MDITILLQLTDQELPVLWFKPSQLDRSFTDCFFLLITWYFCELFVHIQISAVFNGTHSHQHGWVFKRLGEFFFWITDGLLRLLAGGNVGKHGKWTVKISLFILQSGGWNYCPNCGTVFMNKTPLIFVSPATLALRHFIRMVGNVFRNHEVINSLAQHLFCAIAQHFSHMTVDISGAELPVHRPNAFICCFNELAIFLFACFQCFNIFFFMSSDTSSPYHCSTRLCQRLDQLGCFLCITGRAIGNSSHTDYLIPIKQRYAHICLQRRMPRGNTPVRGVLCNIIGNNNLTF